MTNFEMQNRTQDDLPVLSVGGYVGRSQCYRMQQQLNRLRHQGKQAVLVDCSRLSCITNASLNSLLLWAQDFQRHGGQFRLVGLSNAAQYNAQLTGFDRVMLQTDLEAALKSLIPEPAPAPHSRGTN